MAATAVFALSAPAAAGEFSQPWLEPQTAIVLDPYAGNSIEWDKVATDPRVAGVIHKATQGLGQDAKYPARRREAQVRNYLWGSYHLLTTAEVDRQIDNYLAVAGQNPGETYALDVECLDGLGVCQSTAFKVSVAQVEAALRAFQRKTGRLPLIYANHSVAKTLSARWSNEPEFKDVRLWYARFKATVTDFPKGPWPSYALWQFSSEINCAAACPYRVPGVQSDMDLNVYYGTPDDLRAAWPLNR
jgi:GH25 family lysozyme M1 (1,4-beta-N-acetylmuramidase)